MEGNTMACAASNSIEYRKAALETRIRMHMQGAYSNLLEVGRCLIEAKEGGLISHGNWEKWVREQTGFSERQAQRLMQAAREVEPGSALSRLPLSKIQLILTLPEGEREAVAEQAENESLTVRQLREQLNEKEGKIQGNSIQIGSMRTEIVRLKGQVTDAQKELSNMKRYATGRDWLVDELDGQIEALRAEIEEKKSEIANLLELPPEGISPEAQLKIDQLTAELQRAELYAEEQASLRQQAQQQLLDAESAGPQGGGYGYDATDVIPIARTFLGQVTAMPYMRLALARLAGEDRAQVKATVDAVAAWVDSMREAMDTMVVMEGGVIHG